MVKRAKATAKKAPAAKARTAKAKTSRAKTRATKTAKYDQPGAPWWKKIAAPQPKGL
jgi:hypothetical protein